MWKVGLNWICGVEMVDTEEQAAAAVKQQLDAVREDAKTEEEKAAEAAELLNEPEWKRTMTDANAVLVMAVAMFFWGFYA